MKHMTTPRILAGLLAMTLSLFAGASMASAQTISDTPPPQVERDGTVVVTTLANSATTPNAVEGAEFELFTLDVGDIHNEEDWTRIHALLTDSKRTEELRKMVPEGAEAIAVGPTDTKGRAAAVTVPQGVYLLSHVEGTGSVEFSDAFFSVPTMGFEDEWVYDLQIYPKADCDCDPQDPTPSPTPQDPTPEPTPQDPTPSPTAQDPTPSPTAQDPTPEPTPTPTSVEPPKEAPTPGVPTGELEEKVPHFLLGVIAAALAGVVGSLVWGSRKKQTQD